MAMPDAHSGYGFPIGGVAAFDRDTGIISPGGVGYDINCGVRIIKTNLTVDEVRPGMKELIELLFHEIPSGVGSKSKLRASDSELTDAFLHGAKWAVESGYGVKEDLEHCEENGYMKIADPSKVGEKARKRGKPQFGTLGSGNHFLEVQYVDEVFDPEVAKVFGLEKGQVTVMIHCGSRGAGHQICDDYLKILDKATRKYGIQLPDRQLACAPAESRKARIIIKQWLQAPIMPGRTGRSSLTGYGRHLPAFSGATWMILEWISFMMWRIMWQNLKSIRSMVKKRWFMSIERAQRGHFLPDIAMFLRIYRNVGQPVLIPGSMGTPSFVLHGTEKAMELTFGSACHGSGRVSSRGGGKE